MTAITEAERRAAQVRPTPQQLAWQALECIAFCHFGPNTFTGREWGDGREDPSLFNPSAFDARQWVRVCREGGMRMLILTAKHHDGFCLWPSRHTEHSVVNSPWREGHGDVVREVAEACREGGLKFGVYLSPWDRHDPRYGDSPAYNAYYKAQLRELLTQYGEISEVWLDGACAEGPNGKRQLYDWSGYYALVRELQPQALIAICGPDIRWCGNESGIAGETEWSVIALDADPLIQPPDWERLHAELARRSERGEPITGGDVDLGAAERLATARHLAWYPAECDTSIRPGWFYHAEEDDRVKSLDLLVETYDKSVGRNGVLLLNLPPDRRGLIHENDARRVREWRAALDERFRHNLALGQAVTASSTLCGDPRYAALRLTDGDPATCWRAAEEATEATVELSLDRPVEINCAVLEEQIAYGQRVASYRLETWDGRDWRVCARGTTIGYRRINHFPARTTDRVRLSIERSRLGPALRTLALYCCPDKDSGSKSGSAHGG